MNAMPNIDAFVASLDASALSYLRKAVAAPKAKRKAKGYFKTTCRVVFADGAEYRLSVLATDSAGTGAIEQAKRTATAIHRLRLSERVTTHKRTWGTITKTTQIAGRWEWRNDGPGGEPRLRLVGIECPDVVQAEIVNT